VTRHQWRHAWREARSERRAAYRQPLSPEYRLMRAIFREPRGIMRLARKVLHSREAALREYEVLTAGGAA
jgi:hypothetical protein